MLSMLPRLTVLALMTSDYADYMYYGKDADYADIGQVKAGQKSTITQLVGLGRPTICMAQPVVGWLIDHGGHPSRGVSKLFNFVTYKQCHLFFTLFGSLSLRKYCKSCNLGIFVAFTIILTYKKYPKLILSANSNHLVQKTLKGNNDNRISGFIHFL